MDEKFNIEQKVVEMLKTVFDPEIPVNVYDLGLIYKIDVTDDFDVNIDMTLTAPNCPAADFILEDVRMRGSQTGPRIHLIPPRIHKRQYNHTKNISG